VSFPLGAPISDDGVFTSFNRKEKYASEKIDVNVKAADKNYLKTYHRASCNNSHNALKKYSPAMSTTSRCSH